jgi:hypothetical protein
MTMTCSAQALLDSGCLIGVGMLQKIVNKLNATHLTVYTNNTICSGFNNECSGNFPTLSIKISYINERKKSLETFDTTVFILPKTSIDIIIGSKTIKDQQFTVTEPSHFEDQQILTDNIDITTEPSGNTEEISMNSQELSYGTTPLNQVGSKGSPFKAHAHLTTEAHTCIKSDLKSDDDIRGLTEK